MGNEKGKGCDWLLLNLVPLLASLLICGLARLTRFEYIGME